MSTNVTCAKMPTPSQKSLGTTKCTAVVQTLAVGNVLTKAGLLAHIELDDSTPITEVLQTISPMLNRTDLTEDTVRKIADGKGSAEDLAATYEVLGSLGILPLDPENVDKDGRLRNANATNRLRKYFRRLMNLRDNAYLGNVVTGSVLRGDQQHQLSFAIKRSTRGTFRVLGLSAEAKRLVDSGVANFTDYPGAANGEFASAEAARMALNEKLAKLPDATLVGEGLSNGAGGFRFMSRFLMSTNDPVRMLQIMRGTYMLGAQSHDGFSDETLQQYFAMKRAGTVNEFMQQLRTQAAEMLASNPYVERVRMNGKTAWTLVPSGANDALGNTYIVPDYRLSTRDVSEEVWERLYKEFLAQNPAFQDRNPAVVDAIVGAAAFECTRIANDPTADKSLRDLARYAAENIFKSAAGANIEGFSKLATDVFGFYADYAAAEGSLDSHPLSGVLKAIAPAVRASTNAPLFAKFLVRLSGVPLKPKASLGETAYASLFLPPDRAGSEGAVAQMNDWLQSYDTLLEASDAFYTSDEGTAGDSVPKTLDELHEYDREFTLVNAYLAGTKLGDAVQAPPPAIHPAAAPTPLPADTNFALLSLSDLATKHPAMIRLMWTFLKSWDPGLNTLPPDDKMKWAEAVAKFLGTGDSSVNPIDVNTIAAAMRIPVDQADKVSAENGDEDEELVELSTDPDKSHRFSDFDQRMMTEAHPLVNVLLRILGSPSLGASNLAQSSFGTLIDTLRWGGLADEEAFLDACKGAKQPPLDTVYVRENPATRELTVLDRKQLSTLTADGKALPKDVVACEHPWSLATLLSKPRPGNQFNLIAWRNRKAFDEWCMTGAEYATYMATPLAMAEAGDAELGAIERQAVEQMIAIKNRMFSQTIPRALITLFKSVGYRNALALRAQMQDMLQGFGIEITNQGQNTSEEGDHDPNAEPEMALRTLFKFSYPAYRDVLATNARHNITRNGPVVLRTLAQKMVRRNALLAANPADQAMQEIGGELAKYIDIVIRGKKGGKKYPVMAVVPGAYANLTHEVATEWLAPGRHGGLERVARVFEAVLGPGNQFSQALLKLVIPADESGNSLRKTIGTAVVDLANFAADLHNQLVESATVGLSTLQAAHAVASAMVSLDGGAPGAGGASASSLEAALDTFDRLNAAPSLDTPAPAAAPSPGYVAEKLAFAARSVGRASAVAAALPADIAAGRVSVEDAHALAYELQARFLGVLTIPELPAKPELIATEPTATTLSEKQAAAIQGLATVKTKPSFSSGMERLVRALFVKTPASRYWTPDSRSAVNLNRRSSPLEDAMLASPHLETYLGRDSMALRAARLTSAINGIPVVAEISGLTRRQIYVSTKGRETSTFSGSYVKTVDYDKLRPEDLDNTLFRAFCNPALRIRPDVISTRVFAGDKSIVWTINLPAQLVAQLVNARRAALNAEKPGSASSDILHAKGVSGLLGGLDPEDDGAKVLYTEVTNAVDDFANAGFTTSGFKRQRVKNSTGQVPGLGLESGVRRTTRINVILSTNETGPGKAPNEILWGEMYASDDFMRRLNLSYGEGPDDSVTKKYHVIANAVPNPLTGSMLVHLKGNTQSKASADDPKGSKTYETLKNSPVPSDRVFGAVLAKILTHDTKNAPDLITDGDSAKEYWLNNPAMKNVVLVSKRAVPATDGAEAQEAVAAKLMDRLSDPNAPIDPEELFEDIQVDGRSIVPRGAWLGDTPETKRVRLQDVFPGLRGSRVIEIPEGKVDGVPANRIVVLDMEVPSESLYQASHLTHDTKLHPAKVPLPAQYDLTVVGEAGLDYFMDLRSAELLTSRVSEDLGLDELTRLDVVGALERKNKEGTVMINDATTDDHVMRAPWLPMMMGPQQASEARESARSWRPGLHPQVFSSHSRLFDGKVVNMFGGENTAVHEAYLVDVGGGKLMTKFALARLNVDAAQKHIRRGMFLRADETTKPLIETLQKLEAARDKAVAAGVPAETFDRQMEEATGKLVEAQRVQEQELRARLEALHAALGALGPDASHPITANHAAVIAAKKRVLDMLTDEFGNDCTVAKSEDSGAGTKALTSLEVSFEDLFARTGEYDPTAFYVTGEMIPGTDIKTHPGRGDKNLKYLAALGGTSFTRDRNPGASLSAHGVIRIFFAADYEAVDKYEYVSDYELPASGVGSPAPILETATDVLIPGRGNKVVFSPVTQEIIGNDNGGDTDFVSTWAFDRFGRVKVPSIRANPAVAKDLAGRIRALRDAKVEEATRDFLPDGTPNPTPNRYGRLENGSVVWDGIIKHENYRPVVWDDHIQRANYRRLTTELINNATAEYANQIIANQMRIFDGTVLRDASGKPVGQAAGLLRGYDAYLPINTDPLAVPGTLADKATFAELRLQFKKGIDIAELTETPKARAAFRSAGILGYGLLPFNRELDALARGKVLPKTAPKTGTEWVPMRLHPAAKTRLQEVGFSAAEIAAIEQAHTFFGLKGLSKVTNPSTSEAFRNAMEVSRTGAVARGTAVSGIRDTIFAKVVLKAELNLVRENADGTPLPMLFDAHLGAIRYPGAADTRLPFGALRRTVSEPSMRLALEWTKDLVNLIIDDPKDAKALPMGLYPEFLSLYTVLLAGTEFASREDIIKFHGEFVAWTQTPAARIYLSESGRRNSMEDIRVATLEEPGRQEQNGRERRRIRMTTAMFLGHPHIQSFMAGDPSAKGSTLSVVDWYNGGSARATEKAQAAVAALNEAMRVSKHDEKLLEAYLGKVSLTPATKDAIRQAVHAYNSFTRLDEMARGLNRVSSLAWPTGYKRSTDAKGAAKLIVAIDTARKYVAGIPERATAIRTKAEAPLLIPPEAAEQYELTETLSRNMAARFMKAYKGSLETSAQMRWLAYNILAQRKEADEISPETPVASLLDRFSEAEFQRMMTLLSALTHQQAALQTLPPDLVQKMKNLVPFPRSATDSGTVPPMTSYWLPTIELIVHDAFETLVKTGYADTNQFVASIQTPVVRESSVAAGVEVEKVSSDTIQLRYRQSGVMPSALRAWHNDARAFMALRWEDGTKHAFVVNSTASATGEIFYPEEIMHLLWFYGVTVYGSDVSRGASGSFVALIPPEFQAEKWDAINAIMTHDAGLSKLPVTEEAPPLVRKGRELVPSTLSSMVMSDSGWKSGSRATTRFHRVVDIPLHFGLPAALISRSVAYGRGGLAKRLVLGKTVPKRDVPTIKASAEAKTLVEFGASLLTDNGLRLKSLPLEGLDLQSTAPDGSITTVKVPVNVWLKTKLAAIPEIAPFFNPAAAKTSQASSAIQHLFDVVLANEIDGLARAARARARFARPGAQSAAAVPGAMYPAALLAARAAFAASRFDDVVAVIDHLLGNVNDPASIMQAQDPRNLDLVNQFLVDKLTGTAPYKAMLEEFAQQKNTTAKANVEIAIAYHARAAAFTRDSLNGQTPETQEVLDPVVSGRLVENIYRDAPALGADDSVSFALTTLDIANRIPSANRVPGTLEGN